MRQTKAQEEAVSVVAKVELVQLLSPQVEGFLVLQNLKKGSMESWHSISLVKRKVIKLNPTLCVSIQH